ncbi:MAG: hypothetical protein ACE5KQ_05715 [Thermoplasmata archaeon]
MDPSTAWERARVRFRGALANPRMKWGGIAAGVAYALFYLFSLGHLIIQPGTRPVPSAGAFAVVGLENIWRERAPYNYEPIAVFQPVEGFAIFLAVPNLLLAASLAILLALSLAVAFYLFTEFRACGITGSATGFLAAAPAFLTGFACCAPSLAISLGAVSAASLTGLIPIFMPVAFVALGLVLGWNLLRDVPGTATVHAPVRAKS